MEKTAKGTLTKDAVTAVRMHKSFAECVAYASAGAQQMEEDPMRNPPSGTRSTHFICCICFEQ